MDRCSWCENGHQLYLDYHDKEWGVPVHDSQTLLQKLILDGAQAGLSWWTILNKREGYRKAFDNFDPEKMARYDQKKIDELLANPGIVRNKLKVNAAVTNAQAYLNLADRGISLNDYLWDYVDGKPIINSWESWQDCPANTSLSDKISKQLKKDGFKFVGSTIVYAFMQAVGMINDHKVSCFRYKELC